MSQPSIFISIASYRDPECQHTVRDAFAKATHPEQLRVGICWQYDADYDQDCFLSPPPFPAQVSSLMYPAQESLGACWARAQALSLWQGEDYILQIDAHMRFIPGWDEAMIQMLCRCPSAKAALSGIAPHYHPPDALQALNDQVPRMQVAAIGNLRPVSLTGKMRPIAALNGPQPCAFFAANFLFARAAMFRDIPFDPHMYFWGDEAAYSARLWTHGYDIYQPDRAVIYHYWDARSRDGHYKSFHDNPLAQRAWHRLWHLLEIEPSHDTQALLEIERYGMGTVRTLADFWEFSGVDLKHKRLADKALKGEWSTKA